MTNGDDGDSFTNLLIFTRLQINNQYIPIYIPILLYTHVYTLYTIDSGMLVSKGNHPHMSLFKFLQVSELF